MLKSNFEERNTSLLTVWILSDLFDPGKVPKWRKPQSSNHIKHVGLHCEPRLADNCQHGRWRNTIWTDTNSLLNWNWSRHWKWKRKWKCYILAATWRNSPSRIVEVLVCDDDRQIAAVYDALGPRDVERLRGGIEHRRPDRFCRRVCDENSSAIFEDQTSCHGDRLTKESRVNWLMAV